MRRVIAIAAGFAADLVLGDPHELPHPVRWMGSLISALEEPFRRVFPESEAGQLAAGAALVASVAGISTASAVGLLGLCRRVNPLLAIGVESLVCYQMLSTKSLRDESMKVAYALEGGTLEEARQAVSMIVGRDTDVLDAEAVAKAAVETVAENASDGVIAPLFYMALGGAPLAVLYKSVNTMDSMVGYKNYRYRHFGTAAARLDDVLNFVPARIAGALMCAGAFASGLDGREAWRIFKRDRRAHSSPNSAHTEAACAGALGVQLAGGNYYFGAYVDKPTIGDAGKTVDAGDIARANRLLYATALLGLAAAEATAWLASTAFKQGRLGRT